MPITVTRTDSAGASESMSFTYDGSVTTGVTFSGTVNGSIGLTFDNNFWVTSESVNGGAINFTYDNDGRLKSAGDLTITRNGQNGFLTGTALVNASVAIVDSYVYSTFGETASYNAKVGGAAVFDVQYTRDDIGRIVTKTETVGGTTTVYEYGYDVAGRLVSVKEDGVVVSTYDYDANGNRITAVTKTGTYQGFYDLQDRMTKYGDVSYTYTANGELTSKTGADGTTSYNYDVYGNLRGATMPDGTSIEYIIDASDRRIGKKVNGALVQGFIYKDQLEPVAELDGAGNVVARFVYASKGHVPDYMVKGGVTYRVVSDHLGSVRLVVNATDGTIIQRIDYDEFGNITQDTNPGFQPFAFAGGIYDQHTRLIRFGARDYDAHSGRWTSKDLILFHGGDMNLYGYVLGDAINWNDVSGFSRKKGRIKMDDPLTGGLDPNRPDSDLPRVVDKVKEVCESGECDGKPISPERLKKLKGWLKVAKRSGLKVMGKCMGPFSALIDFFDANEAGANSTCPGGGLAHVFLSTTRGKELVAKHIEIVL